MALDGVTLSQRTPQRVEMRRADLTRDRRILQLSDLTFCGDEAEVHAHGLIWTYLGPLLRHTTTKHFTHYLSFCGHCIFLLTTLVFQNNGGGGTFI